MHAHSASVSQELGAQGQWPPLDSTGLAGLLLCELLSLAQRLSETAGPAAQEVSPRRGKCGSTESRDEAAWGRRGCSPPAQPPAAPELHRNTHVRNREQLCAGEGRFMGRNGFLCRESCTCAPMCIDVYVHGCTCVSVYMCMCVLCAGMCLCMCLCMGEKDEM